MAAYRLLEDHYIGGRLLPAGSVVSDVGAGAQLPSGWVPTPNCEPLDASALTAFYAAGPILPGPIRQQFTTQPVPRPATHWAKQPNGQYALTGLGSGLAAVWPWRI
jgi:hypothetical protein